MTDDLDLLEVLERTNRSAEAQRKFDRFKAQNETVEKRFSAFHSQFLRKIDALCAEKDGTYARAFRKLQQDEVLALRESDNALHIMMEAKNVAENINGIAETLPKNVAFLEQLRFKLHEFASAYGSNSLLPKQMVGRSLTKTFIDCHRKPNRDWQVLEFFNVCIKFVDVPPWWLRKRRIDVHVSFYYCVAEFNAPSLCKYIVTDDGGENATSLQKEFDENSNK